MSYSIEESSYQVKLVLHIIDEQFGNVTATVASYLIQHKDVSLKTLTAHIQRESQGHRYNTTSSTSSSQEISKEMIKQALIVLQQHNCLISSIDEENTILYNLDRNMVICRLRFPKLIHIAYALFGDIGEAIIEEILLFGRLQLQFIREGVAETLYKRKTLKAENSNNNEMDGTDESQHRTKLEIISEYHSMITETFRRIVESRLVIRVESEERRMASRLAEEVKRRALSEGIRPGKRKADSLESLGPAKKLTKSKTTTVTKNSKINDGNGKNEFGESLDDDDFKWEDFLWTAGWDEFHVRLRLELCINAARDRFDDNSSRIVKTILSESKGIVGQRSERLTLAELIDKLDVKMDVKTLQKYLDDLGSDSMQFLDKNTMVTLTETVSSYAVNVESIVSNVRKKTIHNIACKTFDNTSARVLQLLLHTKYLEQDRIGDMAIMPSQEAKKRLYQLFRCGWVNYVDISKKSDFSASGTNFVWHLDIEKLYVKLKEDCYRSMLNIRIRRQHEYSSKKDLISTAHQISNKFDAANYDRLLFSLDVLDNALMKTDTTLSLFDSL